MSDGVIVAALGLLSLVGAEFLRQRGVFGQTDSARIDMLWKRVDMLERRDALKSRIILALLSELNRLVPEWHPGPELSADLSRLETE